MLDINMQVIIIIISMTHSKKVWRGKLFSITF